MEHSKKQQIIVEVIEDPENPGQLLLDLGHEICNQLGWKAGDELSWIDNKDGTWTLTRPTLSQ